ncbi:unnamed protein product [Oppiella nova]|uniref:Myotubularin phosphatase domain-containing protein n=1 Tax=Oppiella nova TaxID=334625 RepID=A0A7R9Q9J5_9ACAR|nr:unnamed protein product [Oppiella nova]CAG2160734.1 unnamed protein product [Oppiella nova]
MVGQPVLTPFVGNGCAKSEGNCDTLSAMVSTSFMGNGCAANGDTSEVNGETSGEMVTKHLVTNGCDHSDDSFGSSGAKVTTPFVGNGCDNSEDTPEDNCESSRTKISTHLVTNGCDTNGDGEDTTDSSAAEALTPFVGNGFAINEDDYESSGEKDSTPLLVNGSDRNDDTPQHHCASSEAEASTPVVTNGCVINENISEENCDPLEEKISPPFVGNGCHTNDNSEDTTDPSGAIVSPSLVINGCPTSEDTCDSRGTTVPTPVLRNGCASPVICEETSGTPKTLPNGLNGVIKNHNNSIDSHVCPDTSSLPSMEPMSQSLPFPQLSGETVMFNGTTTDGNLIVTNYRLFVSYLNPKDRLPISLPIGTIETIELRDLFYLYIYTKHVRSFIISFASGDDCTLWYKRLIDVCTLQSKLENLFCFKYFDGSKADHTSDVLVDHKNNTCSETLSEELTRMSFDDNVWRISDINKEFKLCSSYPRNLVVPQSVSDSDLEAVANFRYSRRIPTVVWRHRKNGCVIARSSQPEVGWLGWRNNHDELLLHAIVKSCSSSDTPDKKLLILDARSYTAAVANRAKGGGCECPEYYLSCEVQFMSLANIHSIRKSFHSLRYICESPADQFNWLTLLDNTKWLHNISVLMKSAIIVVNAIDVEERPVLVHCSDGWDRTPQIVALAELMLDPFYRSIDGFKVLIEREWIQFGHKFADRCGNGAFSDDINERCPVFLQWLDCVHQLVRQFPSSFEFNINFLITLIQHTYSSMFGTFICNNMRERDDHQINELTYSVWSYFHNRRQHYVNYIYEPKDQVLRPSCKAKDIIFWSDVYSVD